MKVATCMATGAPLLPPPPPHAVSSPDVTRANSSQRGFDNEYDIASPSIKIDKAKFVESTLRQP
jgi:hypothetical protein